MTSGFSGRCPTGWLSSAASDALRCALHQLHRERAADAVAEEKELVDAEMVHHADLVVGERAPGIVDRDRSGRLAVAGVALVHDDDAEVVLELLRDVDHRGSANWRSASSSRRPAAPAAGSPSRSRRSGCGRCPSRRNRPWRPRAARPPLAAPWANTCGAVVAAAAAAPVVRMVRRLESIIGSLRQWARHLCSTGVSRGLPAQSFEGGAEVVLTSPPFKGRNRNKLRVVGRL